MKLPIIATALLLGLASCKDPKSTETVGTGAGNGENYSNEQGKSDVTETGQHIGANTDSTSVDGEPGNVSSDR